MRKVKCLFNEGVVFPGIGSDPGSLHLVDSAARPGNAEHRALGGDDLVGFPLGDDHTEHGKPFDAGHHEITNLHNHNYNRRGGCLSRKKCHCPEGTSPSPPFGRDSDYPITHLSPVKVLIFGTSGEKNTTFWEVLGGFGGKKAQIGGKKMA